MSWKSALRKTAPSVASDIFSVPVITPEVVDWARLVTVDFETYFSDDYTLRKLSTSEYVRDERFKAQMVGIKIGHKLTKWYPAKRVRAALKAINWATHSVLCHNTQFDGFILSHHYGIVPLRYYDTLSMARGLHSNEIGAGLDEVAKFYGGAGKLDGILEQTKNVLDWPAALNEKAGTYCVQDVDETFRIFTLMHSKMPATEMALIHITMRMFCDPVLKVDIPRVEAELERELVRRRDTFYGVLDPSKYYEDKTVLKSRAERALTGEERDMLVFKRVFGSNDKLARMLEDLGVGLPIKISPAWMSRSKEERENTIDDKWTYAFSKTDLEFVNLPDLIDEWRGRLDPDKAGDMMRIVAKQMRLRELVDCRIMVKSTTNVTRAERFLVAGANGMKLPVGYAYFRAHTGRWGGNNKMNMQNLTRGGELRLSIIAQPAHRIVVADSGQIEARVNAWLWGQDDLLAAFRNADGWDKSKGVARGVDRDAYCMFASAIYNREISTDDKTERFVGKVCIAEGELVLTPRGPVPIELISKKDWLWDGVEWVQHDGLVDQGVQEVITYDGLTATPDHQVFVEDGRVVSLRQAASEMARLQVTGVGRAGIRFCDDHVVADTPRKRLSVRQGPMRPDWYYQADVSQQLKERQDHFVPKERTATGSSCRSAGETVRRDNCSVQQPGKQTLEQLRRARDQVLVQEPDGVHYLGIEELAPQRLQGFGDRQNGQQRGLQAGESSVSDQDAASAEQAQYQDDCLERAGDTVGRVPESVQFVMDSKFDGPRFDWRPNTRKVRVYDIADAGPRKRFTVSGRLVFNCVLGLGYQMGAAKLQITLARGALGGPPVHFTLQQCEGIVNTYRVNNNRIKGGWDRCKQIIEDMAVGTQGSWKCISWESNTIYLPNGLTLKYPDLKKSINDKGWEEWSYANGEMRSKIYGGLLSENLVQALSRIIIGEQMVEIDKRDRVVMTTHDEIVTHVKAREADKSFVRMMKAITTPPAWCSDIPLNAEGGHDINYSK